MRLKVHFILRQKFLSNYKPGKSEKVCVSKLQWWDRHKIDIPIPKLRDRKERRVMDPKPVQNLGRKVPFDLKTNPWFIALPFKCNGVTTGPPKPEVQPHLLKQKRNEPYLWACGHSGNANDL